MFFFTFFFVKEFELLQYSLSSARIFFRADSTSDEVANNDNSAGNANSTAGSTNVENKS